MKLGEKTIRKIRQLYKKGLSQRAIAREVGVTHSTVCTHCNYASARAQKEAFAQRAGFDSWPSYKEELAKRKGFKSNLAYHEAVRQRRFVNQTAYLKDWAKRRGFQSLYTYAKERAKKRQKQPEYRELSYLITTQLQHLNRTQAWLARTTGISQNMTFLYAHGINIPRDEVADKIFSALKLDVKTIDALVEEWKATQRQPLLHPR